ncbi:13026_t:CDS:2 [Ambispora leptoticha]|uniref:13026_t:CDS:1 n=1 Tax=Ambispora leptoticha TaxID=144679 RepID=A0A9N8ZDZ3_9GLOM|nr:13026_t:CDS:2 [Ambispora leptoticha]
MSMIFTEKDTNSAINNNEPTQTTESRNYLKPFSHECDANSLIMENILNYSNLDAQFDLVNLPLIESNLINDDSLKFPKNHHQDKLKKQLQPNTSLDNPLELFTLNETQISSLINTSENLDPFLLYEDLKHDKQASNFFQYNFLPMLSDDDENNISDFLLFQNTVHSKNSRDLKIVY